MKKITVLFFVVMLLTGCASGLVKMPPEYAMETVLIPTENKPETVRVSFSVPAVTHKDYRELADVAIGEIEMINVFESMGVFDEFEVKYLAHVISPLTNSWKEPVFAYIGKNSPQGNLNFTFGFTSSEEWGRVFFVKHEVLDTSSPIAQLLEKELFSYLGSETFTVIKHFDLMGTTVSSRAIAVDVSMLSGFGFVNHGREIEGSKVSQIQDNVSTIDQVIALFGEPTEEQLLRDGSRVYVYYFQSKGRSKAHLLNPLNILVKHSIRHTQVLELRVSDGVVLEHGFSECEESECENVL
jgi:hypothetical protein